MYCPRCSQEQINNSIRFCSRCGFLMTGMDEVIENGGLPKAIIENIDSDAISPRKRGIKQGGLLMLSSFILVPLMAILSDLLHLHSAFVVVTAIITFWGGILRMIYAGIFESKIPSQFEDEGFFESVKNTLSGKSKSQKALPPQQNEPISTVYSPPAESWNETTDFPPTSVTEETTKTLNKKKFPQ